MKKRLAIIFVSVFLLVLVLGLGVYSFLYPDFTGRPYSDVTAYEAEHPYAAVRYTVTIPGGSEDLLLQRDSTEVLLTTPAQAEALTAKAEYLQNLNVIDLGDTALTGTALQALHAAYPNAGITANFVEVLGKPVAKDAAELDLSTLTTHNMAETVAALGYLTKLQTVNLMPATGFSLLTYEEVTQLLKARPQARFNYCFDFYGQLIDLYQEEVSFTEVYMGDEAEAELREVLSMMPNCKRFLLDRCGFSSPVLDAVNKDFPDTKVVWRVFFGTKFNALTDETVVRSSHYLRNDNISEMIYLTDTIYCDIGHNEVLTDISFLAHMPKLKLLIVSGSHLTDLSPLRGLQELEFVELCFCSRIADLSPLEDCPGLKYLNVSGTAVSDLTPIMNLPLERFNCLLVDQLPQSQKNAFVEAHPDCLTVYNGIQPYGYGWRYIDDGYTFNDYYATMRQIFHYDQQALLNGYEWDRVTANDPW